MERRHLRSQERDIVLQREITRRGKDQEAVLTAIIQKATSPAIIKSANEILATVSDCVETNMTSDEMAKFINMQLNDGASWSIESQAASGTGDTQACYSSGSQLLYVMWRMKLW